MFARPKPAPFAVSLLTHGAILTWLAAGPVREKPKSLYMATIKPHASKLVWYDFRAKLPDVSPAAARPSAKTPRADVKIASQEIVAASRKAPRARQLVWQPAPKLELHTELQSPNVLAVHALRPAPPIKPKLFVPPKETPAPAGDAPVLAAPPDIRMARNLKGSPHAPGMQAAKAPPRQFVAPRVARPVDKPAAVLPDAPAVAAAQQTTAPAILRNAAKPIPAGSPLPDPPALAESSAAVSMAIVGLKPAANPPPVPEGARNAQFSGGPQPRAGGTDGTAENATLTVPGLLIRSGIPDSKPELMARMSPTSAASLRAALRGGSTSSSSAVPVGAPAGATRVSSPPDPLWHGRDAYAMAVQMPNVTSYSGSWMIWLAERDSGAGALTLPVPVHKVDPKYYPAAMADRIEGKVRLIAVICKDGSVSSVQLLQALDERLDQSAEEAVYQWRFEPARRNGEPVDIDALIEIPFRLAPQAGR